MFNGGGGGVDDNDGIVGVCGVDDNDNGGGCGADDNGDGGGVQTHFSDQP